MGAETLPLELLRGGEEDFTCAICPLGFGLIMLYARWIGNEYDKNKMCWIKIFLYVE